MDKGLIDLLIDAVSQNCDTANLDRDAAFRDIMRALADINGKTAMLTSKATGIGIAVSVHIYKREPGETGLPASMLSFPLNGPPISADMQKLFDVGMGAVTGILKMPNEDGVIRVTYESGLELGFVPAVEGSPASISPSGRPH